MPDPNPDLLLDEEEQQPDNRDADQLLAELFGRVNERLSSSGQRGPELSELPQFYDRHGNPITNLATKDSGTILSLRRNPETGAVQIDVYAGADAARRRQAAITMSVSYQERDGAVTERREVTDLTAPPPRVPTTVETTRGAEPGNLTVGIVTGTGERQTVSFRNGVPEALELVQSVNGQERTLSFNFEHGQITGVSLNGSEITGPAAQEFIDAARATVEQVAAQHDLDLSSPVSLLDEDGDTPGPDGGPVAKPSSEAPPAGAKPPLDKAQPMPAAKSAVDSAPPGKPIGTEDAGGAPAEKPTPPSKPTPATDAVPPSKAPSDVPPAPVRADAAAPVIPFRVPESAEHRAPEAARDGDRFRVGTFDGANGSRIEFAMAPDGTVRPRAITFRDGSRSEYTYDTAGKVLELVNKNARGQVVNRFFTEDEGETYIEEDATQTPPRRRDAVAGTIAVRDDGTFALRTPNNSVLETQSDGTIVRRFQAADGPRESYIRPDGTTLQLVTIAGQLRPGSATLPDRTRVDFVYDASGRATDVVVMQPNGQQSRYENRDGGAVWTERPTGRTGAMELRDGYTPRFTPRDAAAPPEVREVPPPSDKPGPASERDRVVFLQQRLSSTLDAIYAPRFAQAQQEVINAAARRAHETGTAVDQEAVRRDVEAAVQRLRTELEETRRALTAEMQAMSTATDARAAWASSPVTQRVYRDTVRWMEQQAIPETLRRLSGAAAVDLPPGSPVPVPQQEGLFLIPELFRAQAATGGLPRPDLGIAGTRDGDARPVQLPTEAELRNIGRGMSWLVESQTRLDRQRLDYELTTLLPDIIARNNLPPGWLQEVGRNPEQRRAAMHEMIDLALQVRNYSAAIVQLGLDNTNIANLPPGSRPVYEGTHPNRRLVRLNLDLPQTLDMQNPENLRRIESLRQWLRDNGPRVEQSIRQWSDSQDPSRQVFFGEIQTTGRVAPGTGGQPPQIFDPRDPSNAGRIAGSSEFNLLQSSFTVRRVGGQIFVDTSIQPHNVGWYNYLNLLNEPVGQPIVHPSRGPFNPTDPVAIRDGSGRTHIVQAQNLEGWLAEQRFLHYGSKALTATMDIGMVVASAGSGFTAAAAWRAGSITAGAAVRHVAVAGARGVLGGSGFLLNNAAMHASETGRLVNDVRGLAMALDVAQGTARQLGGGALRWLRGAETVTGALTTAQRIEQAMNTAGWMARTAHRAERGAHLAMEVANVPYAPMIVGDIMNHANHLREQGQPSPFERAARLTRDGREQPPPRDANEAAARQTRDAALATLETYTAQLTRGRDEATQGRIRDLFQRAGRLMDPAATAEERQHFQQELMTIMYGPGENLGNQIRDEELRRGRPLTDAEVRTLRNASFTPNPDMQAAAAAAYLFISREPNGRLPDSLSSRPVTVPAYERTVSAGQGGSARIPVAERTVTQTVTPADIMAFLRQDVTTTDSPSRRLITGDLLVRAGERPPISYAAILRDIASDTRASTADRIDAMMRLAPMINALTLQEARSGNTGAAYGVSAADLERTLRDTAGNAANNADIRAFAAGTLQILRSEFEPERVSRAMAQQATSFAEHAGTEGRFSTDTLGQFRRDAEGTDPVAKLRAVLALRDMGNLGGMTEDRVLNQAVVSTITNGQQELNMQALQALQVADPNRDLRPEDRARLSELLDQDTTLASTPVKLELLRRLTEIAVTPEERSRVARYVEMMLDRTNTRLYAQDPALRAAAVRAIGELNLQNATAVTGVRNLLNPANEPDARVRLAAVQTLERLRVPGLQQMTIEALRAESDPAVRAALVDVRAQNTRPIRDERYMEAVQAHQAALVESQRNNTFDAAVWLRNNANYPLLNSTNYDNLRRERGETPPSTNWWQRNMPGWTAGLTAAELEQRQEGARIEVAQTRISQFQALAQEAGQRGEAGHNARMALLFIATGQNPPFRDTEVPIFREWAAQQIANLCRTGTEIRGEFLKGIQQGLLNTELPAATRTHLLEALTHFVSNTPAGPELALDRFFENPRATTPEAVMAAYTQAGVTAPNAVRVALDAYQANQNATTRAGVISAIEANVNTSSALYRQSASLAVARALSEQFRSLPRTNQPQYHETLQLQRRMIELLRDWNYHSVYPALEAARASHPYPEIQQLATQALADMRDRIDPVWTRTRPDADTPPPARAQALEQVLGSGNADDLVQALFTAARGRPVADAADPRAVLYRRAMRDGGIEPDRPRQEGNRWLIDGAEKVRLAAARVILERNERGDYVNPGFTDDDRRRAAEIVARTAFEGSQPGYRQDALALLQQELTSAPKLPNPLMLVALRDMLLANPSYDRTVSIGGTNVNLRQLLETNFRGDATGIEGGTGTRTRQTGRGNLVEEYRGGELVRTTETMADGLSIVTRRMPGGRLVIEELRNGQVERTVPPPGRTYASVLIDDMYRTEASMEDRMAASTRLLTNPRVAPTDAERLSMLEIVHNNATQTRNEAERLEWSRYLAQAPILDNERDREWRDRGFVAINDIATHARDADVRRQALEMTSTFTQPQASTAMQGLLTDLNATITRAQEQTTTRNTPLPPLPARYRELNDRYQASLRRTGIPEAPRPSSLPDITPDATRTTETLTQLSRLYEQNGRRPEDAATLIQAFAAASRFMPATSEAMNRMRQQVEQVVAGLGTPPLQASDVRLPALQQLMESRGNDALRSQVADVVLRSTALPEDNAAKRIAMREMATFTASADEQIRNRATAAFERIPATDTEARARANIFLLESGRNFLPSDSANRDQNHRFWSHFQRFLERTGEPRESDLSRMARNYAIEFRPAGTAGADQVADPEGLANDAAAAGNHRRARTFYEQALAAREARDGADNIDLARARLRFSEYLRTSTRDGQLPDFREMIRQQELATRVLQAQAPDSLDTAQHLRTLAATYTRYSSGDRADVARPIEPLVAAIAIYERNETTRNHGEYAAALSELARAQRLSGRTEDSYRTFEKLVQLAGREGLPPAQRADVLRYAFERAGSFIGGPQGPAALTAAQQLLGQINGIDGIPREQREKLAEAVWMIGRDLADGGRAADSYQFFDAALPHYEQALGETNGNFTGLLQYYADVLTRTGQTERGNQMRARAREILSRPRTP